MKCVSRLTAYVPQTPLQIDMGCLDNWITRRKAGFPIKPTSWMTGVII